MYSRKTLGHEDAILAIDAIRQAMLVAKKPAVVAVSDAHGELIGLLRLDGAPLPSVVIAGNKAFTATRERKSTMDLGQASRDPAHGFDIGYFGDNRYIGWGGGLPVVLSGEVVGAVAVSGLSEEEDVVLAQIGVEAIIRANNK